MAKLLGNTRPTSGVQLGFYKDRYYGGNSYFHYKTNVTFSNIMVMIEAVGYSYGNNAPIRCAWCFYAYGNGSIYSVGTQNTYDGLSAYSVYKSTDSYIVIVANGAAYYSGWVFNAYTVAPAGYNFEVGFTSVTQTTATSGVY